MKVTKTYYRHTQGEFTGSLSEVKVLKVLFKSSRTRVEDLWGRQHVVPSKDIITRDVEVSSAIIKSGPIDEAREKLDQLMKLMTWYAREYVKATSEEIAAALENLEDQLNDCRSVERISQVIGFDGPLFEYVIAAEVECMREEVA